MRNIVIFFSAIIFLSIGMMAQDGKLTGTITFKGETTTPLELKITTDHQACGAKPHYDQSLLVGENNGLQNVVISVTNAPKGDLKSLGVEFTIDQRECIYTPHVILVPVGVSLQLLNNDGILHNIHAYCKKNRPFNIAQPKYRKIIKKTFKKPEIVKLKCDVHNWMSCYIVVVNHPYHAIANEKGEYTIGGIPPGTYQVEFWHEKLGKMQKEVTIEAGATAKLDVVFK